MSFYEATTAVPAVVAQEQQALPRQGDVGRGLAWSNKVLVILNLVVRPTMSAWTFGGARADSRHVR
jgi:hypothetical protein